MSKVKDVSNAEVREWLNSDAGQAALATAGVSTTVGARGRLNPPQVAVYNKANKGRRFTPRPNGAPKRAADKPTITVPVVTLNSKGVRTTVKRTLTTDEARIALGQPTSRKGRFSHTALSDVLSQREAAQFADQFTQDA